MNDNQVKQWPLDFIAVPLLLVSDRLHSSREFATQYDRCVITTAAASSTTIAWSGVCN